MLDVIYVLLVIGLFVAVALLSKGGGAAVSLFDLLAALLALAGVCYLLIALVRPERFS